MCPAPKILSKNITDPNGGSPCRIDIQVDSEITQPIYVYYQLDNFYQNHRRYVKSRSNEQLLGKELTASELEDDCSPIVYNKDIGRWKSIGGQDLDPEKPAFPCGLVAKSLFNDTFELYRGPEGSEENDSTLVKMSTEDIAWESDKLHKFKNLPQP